MENERYWSFLITILINIGRQTEKDKLELCRNSIGPKQPEQLVPFTLWTYQQAWKVFWKITVIDVSKVTYKSKIDRSLRHLKHGLKFIIEEINEDGELELLCENIWAEEEIYSLDENNLPENSKIEGWIYPNHESLIEILEQVLAGNIYLTESMAQEVQKIQDEFRDRK